MRTKSPAWLPKRVYPHGRKYWFYPLGGKPIALGPIDDPGTCLAAYAKLVAPNGKRPRTVGDALDKFLNEVVCTFTLSSQETYRLYLGKLRHGLGHMIPDEITQADLYDYHAARKAPVRANREISVLGNIYQHMIRWRAATKNPVEGFLYAEENARDHEVTLDELRRHNKIVPNWLRVYSLLKLLVGLRQCDLLKLGTMNVDHLRGVLRVNVGKTRRGKVKVLEFRLTWALKIVLRAAQALPRPRTQTLFFVSRSGKTQGQALTRHGFKSAWDRAQKKWIAAGNVAFWEHDIRAKAADSADEKENRASKLLGHEDARVTRKHYLRGPRRVTPLR